MKYVLAVCMLVISLLVFMGIGKVFNNTQNANNDFLRIHIRANSNSVLDQQIKYKVKNKVVQALIPVIANCNTKEQALLAVKNNYSLIEQTANKVLTEANFTYQAKANVIQEYFPVRSYNETVLNSGIYDALIINLGSGQGNNWWCVVYPPLCFVNCEENVSTNFIYKSKILEIIKNFFNK